MVRKIFINLPVRDLQKARSFYTAVGLANNPQASDETAACMVLSDEIYVMLMTHAKFNGFTTKEIGDTRNTASVINSLWVETSEEVDQMVTKALAAGGKEPGEAKDYGFMQTRSFEDLDGHLWGVIYMDMAKLPSQ